MKSMWVKRPKPTQEPGEGTWERVDPEDHAAVAEWMSHRETRYLPTAHQVERPAS